MDLFEHFVFPLLFAVPFFSFWGPASSDFNIFKILFFPRHFYAFSQVSMSALFEKVDHGEFWARYVGLQAERGNVLCFSIDGTSDKVWTHEITQEHTALFKDSIFIFAKQMQSKEVQNLHNCVAQNKMVFRMWGNMKIYWRKFVTNGVEELK